MEASECIGNSIFGKTIGKGSFSKVNKSVYTLTGLKVAIKIPNDRI